MKSLFIISLSLIILSISCTNLKSSIFDNFMDKPSKELFKLYHSTFKKGYNLNSEEGIKRYKLFKHNLNLIKESNKNNLLYTLGINQFTDWTEEEKNNILHNSEKHSCELDLFSNLKGTSFVNSNNVTARKSYDYKYRFPPVKNQGSCGSCWAFSLAGLMESEAYTKLNQTVSLSEQQLLDCSEVGDCRGGCIPKNIVMLQNTQLVTTDSYGSYVAAKGDCKNDVIKNNIGYKLKGYRECYFCDSDSINKMLGYGPILATMAIPDSFYSYKSGIWTPTALECNRSEGHAVLIVGWGFDENNKEYALVRNSWGDTWGENGYVRVGVSTDKQYSDCGLLNGGYQFTINK